jgi:hypothetical protein
MRIYRVFKLKLLWIGDYKELEKNEFEIEFNEDYAVKLQFLAPTPPPPLLSYGLLLVPWYLQHIEKKD